MERTLNLPSEHPPAAEGDLVLERYRLVHRLGQGGFGVVWLAEDERLQRDVALKVIIHGDDPAASRGAEREALAAARLNHPGIVALYELGTDDGAAYLVSELVKGRTFGELHRAGALSDRDVARIGSALCDALAHAHAHGVVHRDVKPANVIVVSEPAAGAGFAKLADFGVAHLASADPVTQTGDVVGTLAYMAPEQAEGERVTAAADVYSLALTLFEGWTGTNPVRARTPAATARRMGKRLPALERARSDLPVELCMGIDAALDPDPERRPGPEELRDILAAAERDLSDEGGLVEPETIDRMGLEHAGRTPRERLPLPGRAGSGIAVGALALAAATLPSEPSPAAPWAVALVAGLLGALLPRLGWLALAAATVTWLATPAGGEPGIALIVALCAALVPALLPRAGLVWSVPALAPLLAFLGIGPAYIAVAGIAGMGATVWSGMWRRAALGAIGAAWIAAAEMLSGRDLLAGAPEASEPLRRWSGSVPDAVSDAVWPWLTSAAPALLAVFALGALAFGLLVRGRSLALDLVGGVAWAVLVVLALRAFGDLAAGTPGLAEPRGAVIGALVGVALAAGAGAAGLMTPSAPAWDEDPSP